MHHHPVLQHSKSTGQLDVIVPSDNTKRIINNNNNKSGAKFGLLIRTPRRRRANCITTSNNLQPEEEQVPIPVRNRSKSWESKSTWSGWRSLRKISDTLIDYALNEPYKGDSLFDDELSGGARAPGAVYRRRSELSCDASISSTSVAHRSKTVGHAQGVSGCPIFVSKTNQTAGLPVFFFQWITYIPFQWLRECVQRLFTASFPFYFFCNVWILLLLEFL